MIKKNNFIKEISELYITIFFFLFGLISIVILIIVVPFSQPTDFIFNNPLFLVALYLWIKALVIDTVRIRAREILKMPGTVYFIYLMQFFVFLVIYLIQGVNNLGWSLAELISSVILITFGIKKIKSDTTQWLITEDTIRFFLIFILFSLADFFFT
ncbi:hypothetical protein A2X44_03770 [candidate division CPR3 bacterium GWF2_35_18]|uniref:Uncharacterized protein n=1 Tax=candidate division CPR3 bacterium GW2011_GWF2_35_18 TaxID=1618350 RepID=A0A0G0C0K7_UNCC3|nr:MAG: hypothetical protein UR67_C0004G0043 [candidate division CPR3 bacterium GW2011_GWF2_35_18]KKP85624.1 MAG: hypothetical protein UR87_C0043G0006 [candidate division CPR3 bacterium GW2011_GWE2_35_7]OGB63129.1 MAG: hypothetical protein A2X44_03770 [candidate division CPR3 bacterium GWF2_35_18]OGB64057.1 MAG: hypothetical protein A2250_04620 [candidate division CPR3 bacterium RIFOXYA2_FULL_35_13]OGB76219.1 MAG: hypothetical protein A2476_00755 [candidate division CPR3 bacterium RIFOXYC2_FULL